MDSEETEIAKLSEFHALGAKKMPCLIIVLGHNIAYRYWLDRAEMVIGRVHGAHIVLNEANVSRRHARLLLDQSGSAIEDLGSTNGTYVNSAKIAARQRLHDGDLIGIGKTVLKFSLLSAIDDAFYAEVVDFARFDALTGLLSRRFFAKHLAAECDRVGRYGGELSLLLCDLDDFKSINDRYGHQAGDLVLSQVGQTVRSCLRKSIDTASRYGGEEIAILLPHIALANALTVAEKIRAAIAACAVRYREQALSVTASIGVSAYGAALGTPEALIKRADEKLYLAKRAGKNRVES
jgi:diguanylate cyclase (GGDEF)-like protein